MTDKVFRYPGNEYERYLGLLGRIAEGHGDKVVIKPEQWRHSKCYGIVRLATLRHYLQVALHGPDGKITFSYRDFCFAIADGFGSVQKDNRGTIMGIAEDVAERIRTLYPHIKVEVVLESFDAQDP